LSKREPVATAPKVSDNDLKKATEKELGGSSCFGLASERKEW
jgi:hypothetical protein